VGQATPLLLIRNRNNLAVNDMVTPGSHEEGGGLHNPFGGTPGFIRGTPRHSSSHHPSSGALSGHVTERELENPIPFVAYMSGDAITASERIRRRVEKNRGGGHYFVPGEVIGAAVEAFSHRTGLL
jgi:hypothetical protein